MRPLTGREAAELAKTRDRYRKQARRLKRRAVEAKRLRSLQRWAARRAEQCEQASRRARYDQQAAFFSGRADAFATIAVRLEEVLACTAEG